MAEGAKRAHSDLNIDIGGPVEELDVVTVQPRDYSAEMELAYAKNKSLDDVMGHLGNIADNANELNRTINAYDFEVDYKDRAHEQQLEQERLEKAQALDLFNTVSSKKIEMITKIEQAKEQALNTEGGDVLAATQGVLEEYRDAFSDSLEGSRLWSEVYDREYAAETAYGINAKYEVEHAKMYHNLNQIQNKIYQDIAMGHMDIDAGMSKLLTETKYIQGQIPNQKYIDMMDRCFNQLILAKATNLAKVATGDNATAVANSIRDLVNKYGKKTFECLGTNGQKLTDSNGNPVTYTATLTPETVESLLQTAQSYDNKVSGTGGAGATKTLDEYDAYTGVPDIDKKGYSSYLASATPASARQDYEEVKAGIMSNPALTSYQKQTQIQQVSKRYWEKVQPAVAVAQFVKLNPKASVNYNKMLSKLAELDNAILNRDDMTNFSMTFDLEGGGTFTLTQPVDFEAMGYSNPKMASLNSWKVIRDTLRKTLDAQSVPDFVYTTNTDYQQAVNVASDLMHVDQLVSTAGMNATPNPKAKEMVTSMLVATRQAYTDTVGKSGKAPTVPQKIIDKYTQSYLSGDPNQRNMYARTFAECLLDSGYSGILVPQAELKKKSAEEQQALNALTQHMYLAQPSLSDIHAVLTESAQQGNGQYTEKQAKEYLEENFMDMKELNKVMTGVIDANNIPANHIESFSSAMYNVTVGYAKQKKSIGEIKQALEAMGKANFVSIDSSYVDKSVFIGNPALMQGAAKGQYKEQAKIIGKMINDTGNRVHTSLNRLGFATDKKGIKAQLDPNTGRINFLINDELLGLSDETVGKFGSSIGIPYNYMAIKPENYTDEQWSGEVSDCVVTAAALSYVADDKFDIEKDLQLGRFGSGNIDLFNRPQVQMEDGKTATVRSMSFNENGVEVLVPTISDDGKVLSDKEAIALYKRTGKYFGKFKTVEEADKYAELLHNEQEMYYLNNPNKTTESKLVDPVTKQKLSKETASADAIKILSVMQRDNFLQDYADVKSSGGKLGVSPAPRAVKDLMKRYHRVDTAYMSGGNIYQTKEGVIAAPQHISDMLDFAYSKSEAHNKVNTVVNKPLSYDMRGMNFTGVMSAAHKNGFVINRDYDKKKYGNYVSNHSLGMALDFGVNSNNMIDKFSGRVSVKSMENFTNMILHNPAYGKKVNRILTSRPELLDNKPEYAEYARFRNMKNAQGKPLFVDARKIDREKRLDHTNHFHVDFNEQVVDAKSRDFINAFPALATDMANTSVKSHAPVTQDVGKALLYTFGDRYNNKPNSRGEFGMANLTRAEYQMLGVSPDKMHDPTLQARVLANRYQAYSNALGDTDMAIFALAGAKFSDQNGKIMSIQEILNSGKMKGIGGQKYTLAIYNPKYKADPAEQARLNAIYRKYRKELNRK